MGPTWGPPGSCRPQMGPILVPWTLLSGQPPYHGFSTPTWDQVSSQHQHHCTSSIFNCLQKYSNRFYLCFSTFIWNFIISVMMLIYVSVSNTWIFTSYCTISYHSFFWCFPGECSAHCSNAILAHGQWQRKHQSFALMALCKKNPPVTKGKKYRKCFHVIKYSTYPTQLW